VDLVVDSPHHFKFKRANVVLRELLVTDLFVDSLHLQRVNVFELGSHEHAGHSNYVQVFHSLRTLAELEESVH
jgi:hypothetical protein